MVAMAEILALVLLTAAFVLWFRRTPMYRARRRYGGGVPGQFSSPGPTFYGQRTNVPPPKPELRLEDDPVSLPWWRWSGRSKQPQSGDTA